MQYPPRAGTSNSGQSQYSCRAVTTTTWVNDERNCQKLFFFRTVDHRILGRDSEGPPFETGEANTFRRRYHGLPHRRVGALALTSRSVKDLLENRLGLGKPAEPLERKPYRRDKDLRRRESFFLSPLEFPLELCGNTHLMAKKRRDARIHGV